MAKRKVWVESISRYIGKIFVDDVLYEVDVKINGDMNQAEIDITNKNNAGGQAWDWANGNWDEFVPKDGPDVVVWVKTPIEIPTKLRWVCITGVYADKKGAKHLPISEVGWKAGQNSSYGRSQKQKRKKATPKFKIKEDKSSTSTQRVDVGLKGGIAAKSTPGSPQKAKVKERKESFRKIPVVPSNPLDIDAIRASKIAKVKEEEGG